MKIIVPTKYLTLMPICSFPAWQRSKSPIHLARGQANTRDSKHAEALPACQIWQKKTPPLAWTASTIGFHASSCCSVQIPAISWYIKRCTGITSVLEINQSLSSALLIKSNYVHFDFRVPERIITHMHPLAASETEKPPLESKSPHPV